MNSFNTPLVPSVLRSSAAQTLARAGVDAAAFRASGLSLRALSLGLPIGCRA